MRENILEMEWGNVYYWISDTWDKDKKTIFFFHGLTADHTMFEKQYEYFAEDYNIVGWDAPAHGKSIPFKTFNMDMGVAIIEKLMGELAIKKFIAIGQSFGGYIPQAIMCRNSDAVEAFVGIGTSPYGEEYYTKLDFFWLRQVGWMCMCYPWKALKKASAKGATVTQPGYDNMLEMLSVYTQKEYARVMQDYYNAMMNDNQNVEIKCPTLITHGDRDKVGKVKKYCDMWHERTGFEQVSISNAGHNANVDNPEEMNKVIYDFLLKNVVY